ncbi:vWA domain-containing protein [Acanthopleuribacter pedis]|uniref:BatA and WFA domain-containing protein n=1 Tax=Acanthopleuribacter pedis TaxID=442870 RepID=A0A8J7QED8_9BACT|nr:BatA and WFA domain-containing protein [Acanthopleuribacter pedis]MBO1323067.1 BatA and WFA domain-containing protein [Acanthopleuribacter pedis]
MSLLNISFLAPLAFVGLLVLGIPLYLHMRHKPRAERYAFPAIDFLLRAEKKRKRRFHVEQWLLMLFRLLIVLFLVLIFAKPYVDEKFGASGLKVNAPLVVLLDDSASMMAAPDGERFFERAVEQIGDMLSQRGGSAPTLIMLASNPDAFLDRTTTTEVASVLAQLKATTGSPKLDDGYRRALEIVKEKDWQQAILRIYTDGSLSAWSQMPTERDGNVEVIYNAMRRERGVENLGLAKVDQVVADASSIEVDLMNGGGQTTAADLRLSFSDGTNLTHPLRLDGFDRAVHRFGMQEEMPATLTLQLPPDDFDLDNEVIYAPRGNRRLKVLILDGDPSPEALHAESFFFKNALGLEESKQYGYDLDIISPAGLSPAKIDWADVVCLLNADLPQGALLKQALDAGKGVFISQGARVDTKAWNGFLGEYGLELWETKTLDPPIPAGIREFDHPLFSPFEQDAWASYMEGMNIGKFNLITVGRGQAKVPIAFADGTPLLVTMDLKPGRLAIWTSSLDLDWNNFALSFGYVPFVRQMMRYLAEQEGVAGYQNLTVSEVLEQDIAASLNPKHIAGPFRGLDIAGPKPGIYTRDLDNRTEFVQVRLDDAELDFKSFDQIGESGDSEGASMMEQAGFRSYVRAELAPQVQWMLFAMILVESLVAARVSRQWGRR